MILTWWLAASVPAPARSSAPTPARPGVRYAIVEGNVRRIVSEHEYRATVPTCSKIEVLHYPGETIVTNVCYR